LYSPQFMDHPRPLLFRSRMHDSKEGDNSSNGSGSGCDCGGCLVGGCPCADSGSHDECICGRCGYRDIPQDGGE